VSFIVVTMKDKYIIIENRSHFIAPLLLLISRLVIDFKNWELWNNSLAD